MITCLIDTGASCNVINMGQLNHLFDNNPRKLYLKKSECTAIKVFNGQTIKVLG